MTSKIDLMIDELSKDTEFLSNVSRWEILPTKEGKYLEYPSGLDGRLIDVFKKRGIEQLYSHQVQAIERVLSGEDVVVVTPTASGKTMCYNIPVLDMILKNPEGRALYLFPTKALSQDQVSELHGVVTEIGEEIKTFT